MTTIGRIAKNTGVLFVAQIISYVLGFIYVIYVARYLGVDEFGVLSFALAFTSIFGIFIDFGLSTLTVREVARNKSLANKYITNSISIKLIITIITFTVLILTANAFNYQQQTINVIYIIFLYVILTSFSQMFYSLYQAFEKIKYQSISIIINSFLLLTGTLLVIFYNQGIIGIAIVYLLTGIAVLGFNLIICARNFFIPAFKMDFKFIKSTIKSILPFGLTAASISIYLWIDSVILEFFQGNEAVGWYSGAYRLVLFLLFIPIVLNSSLFPVMSRLFLVSKDSLKLLIEKYFIYMLILGIPIGVGTTILSNKIILIILGESYIPSIAALQILIWSMVFIFARTALERLFESTDRQVILTYIFGFGIIFNITLNLLLIPTYSFIGSSIAILLTDIMIFILISIFTFRYEYGLFNKEILKKFLKILLASIIMGIFIKIIEDLNLIVITVAAAIIYMILLYIFKLFDDKDITLFRKLINVIK